MLSSYCMSAGQLWAALSYGRHASLLRSGINGHVHSIHADDAMTCALMLLECSLPDVALPLLESALATQKTVFGEDHIVTYYT